MPWYKFTEQHSDAVRVSDELQATWTTVYAAQGGLPQDAAIFSGLNWRDASTDFYISPALATAFPALVTAYAATECEAPKFGRHGVGLLVGDQRAIAMLEREPDDE